MKKIVFVFLFAFALCIRTIPVIANDAVQWEFMTGDRIVATPVLRNDTLYIGSLDGNFYALNAQNGEELWHFSTGNQIRTTAALYEKIACFESGNVLYGIDMTGSLLWTDTLYHGTLINEHDQWDVFRSSPALSDSIAYIGSEEGWVLGINVKNGERVFQAQSPLANTTIETTPTVSHNKVFVGDWLGVFYAFDLATQELAWQYDTKEDNVYAWVNAIVSKPLIYKDTLYFGGRSCNLYAFDPETGDQHWMYHNPEDKWLFGGPVVKDDVLYVGSSYQQELYAFDPKEPKLLWSTMVYGVNYGDPAIDGEFVFVGTGNTAANTSGSLTLVNRNTHEIAERYDVDGWVETPLVSEGITYFGCADGTLYAIQNEILLNTLRPATQLKDDAVIDLGIQPDAGTVSTSFYLYNLGEGPDSLTHIPQQTNVHVDPSAFKLDAGDSAQIAVDIDLTGLTSGNKSYEIRLKSHFNLIPNDIISKRLVWEVHGGNTLHPFLADEPFRMDPVSPNPANQIARMNYTLDGTYLVRIKVYDSQGHCVAEPLNELVSAGTRSFELDTGFLQSGVYFISFCAGGHAEISRLTVIH